jgi:hypothetical protein
MKFFNFDGVVDGKDLALFLRCYHGSAPPDAMYLADLRGGVPPQFFDYDGVVDGKDLALFLLCFHGQGPAYSNPIGYYTVVVALTARAIVIAQADCNYKLFCSAWT